MDEKKSYRRKNSYLLIVGLLLMSMLAFSGCELIADIFSAGFWLGIIVAFAIVILVVIFIVRMIKRNRK